LNKDRLGLLRDIGKVDLVAILTIDSRVELKDEDGKDTDVVDGHEDLNVDVNAGCLQLIEFELLIRT